MFESPYFASGTNDIGFGPSGCEASSIVATETARLRERIRSGSVPKTAALMGLIMIIAVLFCSWIFDFHELVFFVGLG
jgi:hypothetical protein